MSIIKMRGPIDVLFAFKIFSLPVPTRPGTRTFWQVPDPSRPEVKNPYPSDPAQHPLLPSIRNTSFPILPFPYQTKFQFMLTKSQPNIRIWTKLKLQNLDQT